VALVREVCDHRRNDSRKRFGGTCRLHLKGRIIREMLAGPGRLHGVVSIV
jgi:hypothetical protein